MEVLAVAVVLAAHLFHQVQLQVEQVQQVKDLLEVLVITLESLLLVLVAVVLAQQDKMDKHLIVMEVMVFQVLLQVLL
jgi:mannose/fructose/N-acetylgalactosamine-specific phosphotransferase system component IID